MEKELLYPITNDYRFDQSLDGMWDFKFDSRANGLVEGWQNGLPNSIKMPVPASFNDFFHG